ncbi:RDD family protein [Sulfurimonas autotrophica]|uniref:RDD domain containing protein n=1 Tax=Sulfurimonas autotrophica (strain ATCC BAA-671 / DSM 16294 / JCM 11897 / OK10) TaxID=563040 RepID=E0UR12_SULAO|nr:RDD family protein [Sulfurimonas autotrophica]ADN09968.1 RDD domain containing protein [Sulfurimonas autotrophica DSM 16294]
MRFRKLKKQTKQRKQPKISIIYASYPDKIKALITDMFMIYAPILYVIAYVIMGGKDAFQSSQIAPLSGVLLYGLIYAILISKFGQTPGKKAYNIKVVDDKSLKNISFVRAFVRFVAFLFSATIIIGLLIPFYRKDKKALHDILCHTVEIKVKD